MSRKNGLRRQPFLMGCTQGHIYRDTPLEYGYQWWTFPGSDCAFSAWGRYQQFIYVNPVHGVMIVKTSASKLDDTAVETFSAFEAIPQAL